jgi:Uma2 family endonuclease
MSVVTATYSEAAASRAALIEQLPDATTLTMSGLSWEDYEEVLAQIQNNLHVRLSYAEGRLHVMTVSAEHEKFARFLEQLVTIIKLRWRMNILSFGSATMKKTVARKGLEPDACFYVQRAPLIGKRLQLDFDQDPAPDIAVEVDVYHDSLMKFSIYAALDVPELWLYRDGVLVIYQLEAGQYIEAAASQALPRLSSAILTEYLNRMVEEGEYEALTAFESWAEAQVQ